MKLICLLFFIGTSICQAQPPRLVLPVGHTKAVVMVSFSENGKYIISASDDNTARVWDVASGKELLTLEGHTDRLTSAIFFNHDQYIVTTAQDNTAKIWNAKTGLLLFNLAGHTDVVNTAQLGNNNKLLITSSKDKTAKIWNLTNGKEAFTLIGHEWEVTKALFNYSATKAITISADNTLKIWNVSNGKLLKTVTAHRGAINDICLVPKSNLLLTASDDLTAMAIDIEKGIEVNVFVGHHNYVTKIVTDTAGKWAFTASIDSTVKCWNIYSGQLLFTSQKLPDQIADLSISPNGKTIAIACLDKSVIILDASLGKEIHVLKNSFEGIRSVAYNPTGSLLATGSSDNGINVYSLKTAFLEKKINTSTEAVFYMNYSANGAYYLTTAFDVQKNSIRNSPAAIMVAIVEAATGKEVSRTQIAFDSIAFFAKAPVVYSKEGKYFMANSKHNALTVFDAMTGRLVRTMEHRKTKVKDAFFLANPNKVISFLDSTHIKIWDINNAANDTLWKIADSEVNDFCYQEQTEQLYYFTKAKKQLVRYDCHYKKIKETISFPQDGKLHFLNSAMFMACFITDKSIEIIDASLGSLKSKTTILQAGASEPRLSPDNKYLLVLQNNSNAFVYNANTGQLNFKYKVEEQLTYFSGFAPSRNLVLNPNPDFSISARSLTDGKIEKQLNKHQNWVLGIHQNPFTKQIISHGWDNKSIIWDFDNAKPLCFRIELMNSNWINYLPNGFYYSSTSASKLLHYVTKDLRVITFEQLDVRYNRPDKILEALGNKDTALINSYKKAYQKRIKKLGIDTTQFKNGYSVPESDFINRDAVEHEQTKDKLLLKIKGNDSSYKLDRFNVWVNEVPLFGLRGINISNKNKNSFDTTLTITLSQSENRIETSITNVNGTESYRMPLFVKYAPAILKEPKLHFIGIGINQFANPDYNLSWSVKDIRDLSFKLKSKYPNIITDTLFDSNVTKENILALKKKLLLLNEDDKVIVSYSGHGVLSKDFDYYLSTYSINFTKPEEKGLSYDDLESLVDNIKPRQKLMFIDACHSGEVDKDEIARIEASKKSMDSMGIKSKSTIKVIPTKNIGMANSFELMQNLFVNVGKGTGATIISAAGGMQYAQERGDLKNGVFTYSIIEAFNNNPSLKVSELKKIVGARVTQLTNGLQKPTSRNETNNYDWIIW